MWSGLIYQRNSASASFSYKVSQKKCFMLPFQNSLVLNNKAEIVLSDAVGTNGVIHVINQILVPSHMQDFLLKKVCVAYHYCKPRGFSTVTVRDINHISQQNDDTKKTLYKQIN